MLIDFTKNSDKLFNNSFFEIRKVKTRFLVVYGGSGSGKSVSVHQNALIDILNANYDTLIIRKHAASLYDSCWKLCENIAESFSIKACFRWAYSNQKRELLNTKTGKRITFKGIDDPEKIKSIAGIKKIIIEEANQLTVEDFLELNRRVRGIEGIQIILILNPVSENHWIKKMFVDEDGAYHNDTTVLKFNYQDNKYLTESDIKELERLKLINENHYRIYVLGEWGIEDKNKKFAWAFERSKHVAKEISYNADYILWLTFDFNVNPMTCTAIQHYDNTVKCIRCIKLENSNIWEMLKVIQSYFPDAIYKVTGDATGQNRHGLAKDNMHYYQVIREELNLMNSQLEVPTVNPRVNENQLLVNAVLLNYDVQIDEVNCAPLIYDLTYVEMNDKKEIIKDRSSDKKYADFLDNFRYYLNVDFYDFLKNQSKYLG